jgi:hypothetical protein
VRDTIGEDGANVLCNAVLSLLRAMFPTDSAMASTDVWFLRNLSANDKVILLPAFAVLLVQCVRLILVNEFTAREFAVLGGCEVLAHLVSLCQHIAFPAAFKRELYLCLLEAMDKPGLPEMLGLLVPGNAMKGISVVVTIFVPQVIAMN